MEINEKTEWEKVHKMAKAVQEDEIEVEKGRIYMRPGEKPPKGVSVHRGKRGGTFYESTGSALTTPSSGVARDLKTPKDRKLWEPSDAELLDLKETETKYGISQDPSKPIAQSQKFAVQRIVALQESHEDPAKVDAKIKQLESTFGLDKRKDYFQEYANAQTSTDSSPGKIRIHLPPGDHPPKGISEKRDPSAKTSYWEIKVPVKQSTESESKRVKTFQDNARNATAKSKLKPTEIFEVINAKIERRAPKSRNPKREYFVDDFSAKLTTYLNEAKMSPETRKKTLQSLKKK